jgi:hypothetical protein
MGDFFSFDWLKARRPKSWSFNISIPFSGFLLDAGRDRCQLPGCGVMRKVHGLAHKFVEKES